MLSLEKSDTHKLTTMRIGGRADYIFFPESIEELISLFYELKAKKINWTVIGAGSNTLASTRGVEGAVICTTSMNWINRTGNDTIVVGSGMRMPKLAGQVAQMSLSGLEFYEGIPGSVGGAIIMNAGAHTSWTSNIVEKITIFDTYTFDLFSVVPSQVNFGYRHSNIDPKRYIIAEAKYRLNTNRTTAQIQALMKEYSQSRNKSQPKGYSSGCIFRNPADGIYAGMLIDQMGLKGSRIGMAEISNIHGNFIVNSQEASSDDVCNLIHLVQYNAWREHSIWLKPEVQPMGNFEEKYDFIWQPIKNRPKNWEDIALACANV